LLHIKFELKLSLNSKKAVS